MENLQPGRSPTALDCFEVSGGAQKLIVAGRESSYCEPRAVDPFRCRVWEEHARLEEHITEESCKGELDSFQAHGQLLPALARPIARDPAYDFELIYGARRLFVARLIGVPILVQVCDLSDREAAIAMDIENQQRKDLSAYERGLSYTRWLREKLFDSQDDLAKALRVSGSQVSRLLRIARLPSVVVNSFSSPLHIRETWGLELFDACQDPARRHQILERARNISGESPRRAAAELYKYLMAFQRKRGERIGALRDEIVKSAAGETLFRVTIRRNSVALVFPSERLSSEALLKLKAAASSILQDRSTQTVVATRNYTGEIGGSPPRPRTEEAPTSAKGSTLRLSAQS